jgi:branched-chain amino acid transport system ATP-binding protein
MNAVMEATQGPALLRVENLSAGYGGMRALHGASLEIRRAEIVALVGSNGAGKTTLLRALSRTIASTGTVTFDGCDLTGLAPDEVFALGLVQLPEGRQLFDRMTVHDNLLMGAYRRRDAAAIADDLDRVYALFPKMKERRHQLAGSMSGGEQQMCAMGRALMARPKLMMVDEMSLGLAPVVVDQLMEVLGAIRDEGVTVLLVEQDVQLALAGSNRGYVLETGRVVHTGNAADLVNDPAVRQAYLGL